MPQNHIYSCLLLQFREAVWKGEVKMLILANLGTNVGEGSKILFLWKPADQSLSFIFLCACVILVKNVKYKINAL